MLWSVTGSSRRAGATCGRPCADPRGLRLSPRGRGGGRCRGCSPSGSCSTMWLSQILSNSVRGFDADIFVSSIIRALPFTCGPASARRCRLASSCAPSPRCARTCRSGHADNTASRGARRRVGPRSRRSSASRAGHALHTLAVADLADGKVAVQALVGARDADPLEGLGAGALAFDDLHRDAQRVAGREVRHGAARRSGGDLLGLDCWMMFIARGPSSAVSLRRGRG